jgi:hypothetical protein
MLKGRGLTVLLACLTLAVLVLSLPGSLRDAFDRGELIRHENDVTNHRIMWFLIVQGLLINAYVGVRQDPPATLGLAWAGIFVTLSAFVMLYKSYQAQGYLHFLGTEAKRGQLQEEYLQLDGWSRMRIKGWRSDAWVCPWLGRAGDVLEPYLSLPIIIVSLWTALLLRRWIPLHGVIVLAMGVILAIAMLFVFCMVWVWSQRLDEEERRTVTTSSASWGNVGQARELQIH